jgi:hypothetical protein
VISNVTKNELWKKMRAMAYLLRMHQHPNKKDEEFPKDLNLCSTHLLLKKCKRQKTLFLRLNPVFHLKKLRFLRWLLMNCPPMPREHHEVTA